MRAPRAVIRQKIGRVRHALHAARDDNARAARRQRLAAMIAACMPEPHILLTVVASTLIGNPAPSAACRAGACPSPAASTQPI